VLTLGRLEVGIVRWDGEQVYALRNVCPHAGGPVCEGRLGPRLTTKRGEPMQLEVDDSQPTVTCAWHGWEFDVRDGRAIAPGNGLQVRSYPACVRDGVVLVDLGATAGR
jgi:nitrite reductase (NADH) small subunit